MSSRGGGCSRARELMGLMDSRCTRSRVKGQHPAAVRHISAPVYTWWTYKNTHEGKRGREREKEGGGKGERGRQSVVNHCGTLLSVCQHVPEVLGFVHLHPGRPTVHSIKSLV